MEGFDVLLGMLVVLGAPLAVATLFRWLAGDEPVGPTGLYRYPEPLSGGTLSDESGRWDPDAVARRSPRQQPGDEDLRDFDGAGVRRAPARPGHGSATTLRGSVEAGPRA